MVLIILAGDDDSHLCCELVPLSVFLFISFIYFIYYYSLLTD
jgi:hypothetical protein